MSAIKQLFRKLPTSNPQLRNVATKLTDMTWYSFFESGERLKVSYIFRSKGNELLVIKNGKVLASTWSAVPSTNSLLITLGEEQLSCYAVLSQGHYLLLRIAETGDYKLLINHAYFQRILEVAPKKVEQVITKDLNNLIPEPDIPVIELNDLEEDEPATHQKEIIDNELDTAKTSEEVNTKITQEETLSPDPIEESASEEPKEEEVTTHQLETEQEIEAAVEEEEVIAEEPIEEIIAEPVEEVSEIIDNQFDKSDTIEEEQLAEEVSVTTEEKEERTLSILEKLHQQKGLVADEEEEEDEIVYPFGEKKLSLNDKLKEKLKKEKQETLLDKLANKAKKD